MSSRLIVAALTLLTLATAAAPASRQAPAAVRHSALLIGISDYARGVRPADEWWNLSSHADIEALRSLLIDKFSFQSSNIVALTTASQTTRDAILSAFDTLIAETGKGDIVYIHYSGHGAPVIDRDGDEIDGFDESLVPSDYVSRKDGSRNLTDDLIGAVLARLKAKQPASITLTFDSCFSGTQTRGGRMLVRGGNFLDTSPAPRGQHDPDVTGLGGRDAFADGYVVISAARHDQLATETSDEGGSSMGLLTYALVHEMRAAGPGTTYRDLFDRLLDRMTAKNPGQVPQIEGDIDGVVMSGAAAPSQPYFDTRIEDGRLMLQAGSLHGITAGSEFALYPGGTRVFADAAPVTRASVTSVRATTAVLTPVDAIDLERLRLARAVESAHKFRDTIFRVDVSDVDRLKGGASLFSALQRLAEDHDAIQLTRGGEWDLKICQSPCAEEARTGLPGASSGGSMNDRAVLIRHDGSRAASLPGDGDVPAALVRAIEAASRWRMIAALERRDPRLQVEVRLVPVNVTRDSRGAVTAATPSASTFRTAGGLPVMEIGDSFMVELRNRGTLSAYVTVLDLSPDGTIHPVWPHPGVGRNVQENRLRAAADPAKAEWVRIPLPYVFAVGPPVGNEIIKVIATEAPTDFSSLLTASSAQDGASRGGQITARTALGRLLASAARGTRSARLSTEPPDPTIWSTGSFTFVIQDRAATR